MSTDETVCSMTRQEMANAEVTLNGHRAKVCGTRLDFARVVIIKTGEGYEWSWAAVEHVIRNRSGAFKS